MSYVIADWRPAEDGGREPDLPQNADYLLLADPGESASFGLFEVQLDEDDLSQYRVHSVCETLERHIESAKGFAPALALARDDVTRQFDGRPTARVDFLREYSARLEHYLVMQDTSPYFLARACIDQTGYIMKGAYYWLVGYDSQHQQVEWVSDDYFVYTDPDSCFEVPRYRLRGLSRWHGVAAQFRSARPAGQPIVHDGDRTARQLQSAIDKIVRDMNIDLQFKLGPGSEESHLASNVDLHVSYPGFRARRFTVISRDWAGRLCEPRDDGMDNDVFANGSPLVIVRTITPDSVVMGIMKYLEREERR